MISNAGIETLNPRIRIRKYLRKKYTDVVEQLFPSYVFACFDSEKHLHMIKYTRGVRYIVGKSIPIAVPPEIIETIREQMQDGIVTPMPENLEHGDRVLINEGPFKDFYGIFQRNVPGRERVMILLEALHSRLEIESRSVRKIK